MTRHFKYAFLFFVSLVLVSSASAQDIAREAVIRALPELTALAEDIVKSETVPGLAIAVVHQEEVLYIKGFGVRQFGHSGRVGPDTVFPLASVSKPLAATVVASLVGKNAVTWDTTIKSLDKSFRSYDPYVTDHVTLRDLFSHRSGMSGMAGNDLELIGYDQETILERLHLLPASGSFRSSYAYSNFGLTLGALAAARAADKPWEELAYENVFEPLRMTKTSYHYTDFLHQDDRTAMHTKVDGKWQPAPDSSAKVQGIPSGGASSTARDLAHWMLAMLNHGRLGGLHLLDATALAETQNPVISTGKGALTSQPSYYGLGWAIDTDRHGRHASHNGASTSGIRALVDMMPDQRIGIIVLANGFPSGVPEGLAAAFFDLVTTGKTDPADVKAIDKKLVAHHHQFLTQISFSTSEKTLTKTAPLSHSAYVGEYHNDYVGQAKVVVGASALQIQLGPKGIRRFALYHHDRDVFFIRPIAESPDIVLPVIFTVGPSQRAIALELGYIGGSSHNRLLKGTQ